MESKNKLIYLELNEKKLYSIRKKSFLCYLWLSSDVFIYLMTSSDGIRNSADPGFGGTVASNELFGSHSFRVIQTKCFQFLRSSFGQNIVGDALLITGRLF